MKSVTVDMLRAHLLTASIMAMGMEGLVLLALLVWPIPEQAFDSDSFRLLAVAVVTGGVLAARRLAYLAFERAVRHRYVAGEGWQAREVSVAVNCPRRALVVLHLRFTGTPFVLAER